MSSTFLFLKFLFCFTTFSSLAAEDDNLQQMSDSRARPDYLEPKQKALERELTDEMGKNLRGTGDETGQISDELVRRIWAYVDEKHPLSQPAE